MIKIRCPVCEGSGRVPVHFGNPDAKGYESGTKPCPACEGTGIQIISDYAYMGHFPYLPPQKQRINKPAPGPWILDPKKDKCPFTPKFESASSGGHG